MANNQARSSAGSGRWERESPSEKRNHSTFICSNLCFTIVKHDMLFSGIVSSLSNPFAIRGLSVLLLYNSSLAGDSIR